MKATDKKSRFRIQISAKRAGLGADKDECEKIFIATGSKARKSDIRFCRRLGEKGEDKERPVLLGMKSKRSNAKYWTRQRN